MKFGSSSCDTFASVGSPSCVPCFGAAVYGSLPFAHSLAPHPDPAADHADHGEYLVDDGKMVWDIPHA